MGLFDFLAPRKPARSTRPPDAPAPEAPPDADEPAAPTSSLMPSGFGTGGTPDVHLPPEAPPLEPVAPEDILPTLHEACARLERKDLPGALHLYENLLARQGDTPEALMTLSADLGANGFIDALIEIVAPVYDPHRHGPMAGINLLQAYLAVQNTDAAQQLLDVLISLGRPELESRLHGLAGALEQQRHAHSATPAGQAVNVASLSKPVWSYGLEAVAAILPTKNPAARKIAFVPMAVPRPPPERGKESEPDPALLAWARAVPLVAADAFYFTTNYSPLAIVTLRQKTEYWPQTTEWLPDQVRGLSTKEGGECTYAVTGFMQADGEQIAVGLRVWEAAKARPRKLFTTTCSREQLGGQVSALLKQLLYYLETQPLPPEAGPFVTRPEALPTAQLTGYAHSLDFFLVEKQLLPREILKNAGAQIVELADLAATNTADARATALALSVLVRARALEIDAGEAAGKILDAVKRIPSLALVAAGL